MIKKINLIFLVLLALGFVANADALMIDFRSPEFHSADGLSSKYFSTYGLNVAASPGSATLYHDGTDGFGVRYSYENDEIEGCERLHLSFDSAVSLNGFLVTDLFNEPYNNGDGGSYLERGSYSFDNASWNDFLADTSQTPGTNGELYISPASSPLITELWFKSLGWNNCGIEDHEFSLAQIDVNPVPEPATMLLLGSGLVAIAGFGRKKVFKKRGPDKS